MSAKLQSWEECLKLARSGEDLEVLLRARLLQLAFTQVTTTATKAIEMLQGVGYEALDEGLGDVTSEKLREINERANDFIRRESANGAGGGPENAG